MKTKQELFDAQEREKHVRTDRIFAYLMAAQWLVSLALVYFVSPLAVDRRHPRQTLEEGRAGPERPRHARVANVHTRTEAGQ